MKKLLLLIMACNILTGCSYFNDPTEELTKGRWDLHSRVIMKTGEVKTYKKDSKVITLEFNPNGVCYIEENYGKKQTTGTYYWRDEDKKEVLIIRTKEGANEYRTTIENGTLSMMNYDRDTRRDFLTYKHPDDPNW